MNFNTLIQNLRDGLATDSTIETWCQSEYSKSLTVVVGADKRNLPGASDCPLIHLFPLAKKTGYDDVAKIEHVIGVVVGVHDTTVLSGIEANITEYEGVENLESLRKLVENAFVASVPSAVRVDEVIIAYDSIEDFPFFWSNMQITLVQDLYQGDDPLA